MAAPIRFPRRPFPQWKIASLLEAGVIEMAEYFWYFNHAEAHRDLWLCRFLRHAQ